MESIDRAVERRYRRREVVVQGGTTATSAREVSGQFF